MLKPYKAPLFKMIGKRLIEVPISGTLATGAWAYDYIGTIAFPFRILKAKMIFSERARNNVRHYWTLNKSKQTQSSGVDGGDLIFTKYAVVQFFSGDSIVKKVSSNIEVREKNMYIVLSTNNTNAYPYDYSASVTIEEL